MGYDTIKLKLTHDRLQALNKLYGDLINIYQPDDTHEALLLEHAIELQWRIGRFLQARRQETYTMSLSSTEAMAFYQMWSVVDVDNDPYGNAIILSAIEQINKQAIQSKIIGNQ
jgi:hypothetical protein